MHICGVKTVDDIVTTCLPTEGDFDFGRFAQALKDIGYNGAVTLEVYPGNFSAAEELYNCYKKMQEIFS